MSYRFPKTHTVIGQEFPGDDNKALRHELYQVIHRLPLHASHPDALPPNTTVVNYPYDSFAQQSNYDATTTFDALQRVQTSLAAERYGMVNLPTMVASFVKDLIARKETFTFHDVTSLIRRTVNHSRLVLLDDRDFEEIEIVQGAPKSLTQNIPHTEVKAAVIQLWDEIKASGYAKVYNSAGHFQFEYRAPRPPIILKPTSADDQVTAVLKTLGHVS